MAFLFWKAELFSYKTILLDYGDATDYFLMIAHRLRWFIMMSKRKTDTQETKEKALGRNALPQKMRKSGAIIF